jgi:DnaJ family protein C protein 2
LKASKELETQDQLENAESRYEKRWYQKEIDRKAKKLKQVEQARITTLVERAMAADPRLQQEKERLVKEKVEKQRRKEQEALEKKAQQEEARLAEEQRLKDEGAIKKDEKMIREKEKKVLRKTKQAFRKLVSDALASLLESEHALEDEVDLICTELSREQLVKLNTNLESKSSPGEILELVRKRANNTQDMKEEEEADAAAARKANTVNKLSAEATVTKKVPFTKEEMASLAKGVKKFAAGGGNRWDQIAAYINNVCQPDTPRTKEECIETFKSNKSNGAAAPANTEAKTPDGGDSNGDGGAWTDEEDKALQAALAKFPATMAKNKRWTSISNVLEGKSKQQCVQRFKEIRDALKHKK